MFEQTINHLSQIYNKYVYPEYTDIKGLQHVKKKNFYYFFVKGHKRDEITKVMGILKRQGANCFAKSINNLESIQNDDTIDFFFCPSHYEEEMLSFHNKIIQNVFETRKLCERIVYTNQESNTFIPQEGLHLIKRHTRHVQYSPSLFKKLKEEEIEKMLQIAADAMGRLDMARAEKTM